MDLKRIVEKAGKLDPRIASALYGAVKSMPFVRSQVRKEYGALMKGLEGQVKPYRKRTETHARLPVEGFLRQTILSEMEILRSEEEPRWKDGFASGAVYHGDEEHIAFLSKVYSMFSQANPLHSDLWPSIVKFEAEIVSMTAAMLHGDAIPTGGDESKEVCGTVTSGGTESILLAMKAYRDHARATRGIRRAEMIVPVTAHAAFEKAAEYFGMRLVKVPVDQGFRAEPEAVKRAITRNTAVIVGSAPSFPHGMVDPIEELSTIARTREVGCHVDACLGGFVLPWAEKLGYRVPPFDFRLPGVTSMSADTHKYGYAAKGTSVVLYRGHDLRHRQYFRTTEWPGGLYFSPTFAGSRPGALSAACWASMISIGEKGYMDAARRILETAASIKHGIRRIPDLRVLGDPLWVISFASDTLDIYRVMDRMTSRGWSLNGLHRPACVHICVTLRHAQAKVAERFLLDLAKSVEDVRSSPEEKGGMAPVYGMAATMPVRGLVADMLDAYMDLLFRV